ncbi:ATP-binding protein [Ramlibacter sp. 2FC]|uniref:ATP-binding protein n=1 Tax=Ramlibacter sp. 2FC TaxID=2502188 RepID=UPI0010F9D8D2|nr:ATP-binding protein [Ramlibacter sp. 2FC]
MSPPTDPNAPGGRQLSARLMLALLAALIMLPMLLIEWASARREQAQWQLRAQQDTQLLAETVATGQEQFVLGIAQLLVAAAASPVLSGVDLPACQHYVQEVQQRQTWLANLGLLDAGGRLSCRATTGGENAYFGHLPFYQQARDENLLSVGEYMVGPVSGKQILNFGWPVRSDEGRFQGVVFASLDLAWLDERLRNMPLPEGAEVFLTDLQGRVLAGSVAGHGLLGLPLPDLVLRAAMRERRSGFLGEAAARDLSRLRVIRPIRVSGRVGLYVTVSAPADAAIEPALRDSRLRLAATLLVTLAAAALAWLIGERWLVRPLRRLVRGVQRVAQGDPAQALAPSRTPLRELVLLKQAMAQVAQRVEEQRQAHQKTQQALRESEAGYHALFDSSPLPMWVLDEAQQRFLAVNAAAAQHYGYEAQAFLALRPEELQPPALQAEAGEGPAVRTHRKHSGELCRVQLVGSPTSFQGREARLCMAIDVTQSLADQARVHEVNDRLEQLVAERTREVALSNRELEAFSYSVSHDLRNPLHAVAMFAEFLAEHEGAVLDEQGRLYLDRIQDGTRRMQRLIDDLLELARVARAELAMTPLDLSALALEVAQELLAQQPGRAVTLRIEPGLYCVGDPRLLRQLLVNLLGNAWKFTAHAEDARIELGFTNRPGEPTSFFIADNGAGFDMKLSNKLFEPFQRLHTESEFPGSGVGLATVQRIVARHGGRVWAHAAVGQGASFHVVLPGLVQHR